MACEPAPILLGLLLTWLDGFLIGISFALRGRP